MKLPQIHTYQWFRVVVAMVLVMLAAAMRIWPLQALGSSLVWLTFYPVVMIAALYGGLYVGLLATVFTCLIVVSFWPLLVAQPFIDKPADWLGVGVFVFTGAMISSVAEAMLRANANAKKAQQQAEAANRAKSEFLATMSHELRTPLNAILGFTDLMLNDPNATREQRENLTIINRSGEHLLSLINDVLDMAKVEAGKLLLDVKPCDFNAMIQDIINMMRVRAEEKSLQLLLDQPADLPRFIKIDADKLRQILVNLISNAIKYTDQGGVSLRIFIQQDKEPRLVFGVEDSGIGISYADQVRIFEPFVQVGKPATHKGTGLGLALVYQYVELMGGSINVESKLGKGSLFRVSLPMQLAEASELIPPEVSRGAVIGIEPNQPTYRIMIVEDQEENWLLLRRLLLDAGFSQVEIAKNGAEAVEMFQRFHPDFIWMDRRMPIENGMEATRRIRALESGKKVKIVAVTASAFLHERQEMLDIGMDDFIRKPYRASEIYDCLEKHLGVRFIHKQATVVETELDVELSPAILANLPVSLRQELTDSLILGNNEQLVRLVQQITQQHPAIAKLLAYHLNSFNYLPILNALEAIESNSKELVQ